MMHRADHAASRVQHHIEVNHGERYSFAYHPKQHENIGNHDRSEQLEKIFHPQVYYPESPKVGARKMRRWMCQ